MSELIRTPQYWLSRSSISWQRGVIVLLALCMAVAIAFIASPDYLLLALLAISGLFGAIIGYHIFSHRPALGLVLLIPTNMIVPFSIGVGTQASIHATLILLGILGALWFYQMVHVKRKMSLIASPPVISLLLFLLASIISFFVGQLPWFWTNSAPVVAQIGGLSIFFFSVLGFLLAAHQFDDIIWLERFTWTFLIFGAIFLLFRIIPALFRYSGNIFMWGSTNSQFWTWLIAMAVAQLLFNKDLRGPWRLGLVFIILAGLYANMVQTFEWRSGWVPALIAIGAIVALYDWRIAAMLAFVSLIAAPSVLQELIATDEYSYSTRLDAWVILLEIIRANPILGLGPANYYYYTPLYEIRGYNVRFNSHNQYIDLVAQVGIIGLMLIIWFFMSIWNLGWRLRNRVPEGFARAYTYGVLGGLLGTAAAGMLGDWFLPFAYNVGIVGLRSSILTWLFFGGLVALDQIVKKEEKAERLPQSV